MNILHISASYKPAYIYGGPVMSVAKLCEELSEKQHTESIPTGTIKVQVYTTLANGANELEFPANELRMVDGVAVTYFKRITKDHSHFSPALYTHLWKTLKNYDLVHIHAWWNLVSVISCFIALLRGVKVILSPRGTLSSYSFYNRSSLSKRIFQALIGKPLLKHCYFHVTSKKEEEDILKLLKKQRGVYIIPNFVKLCPVQQYNNGANLAVFKLLFLSRIEEKKGLDILLNALINVSVPYHLTIAGDGNINYIKRLKQISHRNNIAQHISWIGFQQEHKFDIMAQHDLLILPSHDENFGNVVIESLSVGTPVLVGKAVGLADYVANKNLGWVCNNSIYEISSNIDRISTQKDLLKHIRITSPITIKEDFDTLTLSKRYKSMYQKINHH